RVVKLHIETVQLDDGDTYEREVIRHSGAVAILPFDEDGNIYMVRQFRTGAGGDLLELPAGQLKLLLPWTLAFFGKMEIFMVNSLGLPFNSGTIVALALLVALFYFGLGYTRKNSMPQYNTVLLCILFILIGFSTWMMLPIRANANVVINENKPSDAAEV